MKAYLFPGQGSQFVGMGEKLYKKSTLAKKMFHLADELLGFKITSIMFNGTDDILKQTINAQLSIYICSVIETKLYENFNPDMVAGLSIGEFSALTAINVFSFEDGLYLVNQRASLMQKICEKTKGNMIVIIGLKDKIIENICKNEIGIVVLSNYIAPNHSVISGELNSVKRVCSILKKIGAKKIIRIPVYGAFHSPIMKSAEEKLKNIIMKVNFNPPVCPIYQNFIGKSIIDSNEIKKNIIKQMGAPVKWKQSIKNMIIDGASKFIEIGPGKSLEKIAKIIFKDCNK
ncbi:ACP S-malonyltransferase [Blattabacterium cuenoti]|uniref:ACP S-malonyltransferase n=1 Tax=Blattabacterium cuenoti TaxID=1653831 RepID=UPI00163B7589|nr:ACP S-malonyltransferase [Blattabacterium cuenoti]